MRPNKSKSHINIFFVVSPHPYHPPPPTSTSTPPPTNPTI